MSNGNMFERLWKLLATANKLVLDGKRDAEAFCNLLQAFIEVKQVKVWKTWKTIKFDKFGAGPQSTKAFCRAAKPLGIILTNLVNDFLVNRSSSLVMSTHETQVDLVVVSVAELDFKNGGTFENIQARAQELGLDLCPPEVGLHLRLQYTDQPKDEWLYIAMKPITYSIGRRIYLFGVGNVDSVLYLASSGDDPDYVFDGNCRFVFLRRK